ncbi:Respiratory nitrate reductase delta chain [hydrothermal vent metagenome]|uniref:Respiratory nitrate reductase delta chain n=1 Tax=hydrothermal vent metagenome TaxID=652676 RepID=A0A3B0TQY7_9ZZZZ
MANALKIISALLSYPTPELLEAGPELSAALEADNQANKKAKAWLKALVDDISGRDIYDAQERYVLLFDRTRTNSLHLFEHVHGESRDRGQAMVDLAAMYDAQGFEIDAKELPDFLPLFLEYLSTQSDEEVHNLLGQTLHVICAIRQRLQKRKSIYANAFLALEAIANAKPDAEALANILEEPDEDPNDLEALDKIWEDEAISFGAANGPDQCDPDRLRSQIRAHNRPAPPPEHNGEH